MTEPDAVEEPKAPEILIPWYRNEHVLGRFTSEQLVKVTFGLLVGILVVLLGAGYLITTLEASNHSQGQQTHKLAESNRKLTMQVAAAQSAGRQQRIDNEAAQEKAVADLACTVVSFFPPGTGPVLDALRAKYDCPPYKGPPPTLSTPTPTPTPGSSPSSSPGPGPSSAAPSPTPTRTPSPSPTPRATPGLFCQIFALLDLCSKA